MRRVPTWILIALPAGAAVGAVGRLSDHMPLVALRWSASLGALWLLGAFAVGARTGRRRGAAAGALALVTGVVAYYLLMWLVEERATAAYSLRMIVLWGLASLAVGALFGHLGQLWRDGRRRELPAAVLGGALVGEAALLLGAWQSPAARLVLLAQLAAGALLALTLAPTRRVHALAGAGMMAVAMAAGADALRDALHAAGWRGA